MKQMLSSFYFHLEKRKGILIIPKLYPEVLTIYFLAGFLAHLTFLYLPIIKQTVACGKKAFKRFTAAGTAPGLHWIPILRIFQVNETFHQ